MSSEEGNEPAVYFPQSFTPSDDDVIIGRGKKCYCHTGNQKLRRIVASRMIEYSGALSQKEKSQIIMSIIKEIRTSSTQGAFVKLHPKSGLWFDIGDTLAREKISQAFRDALHGNYKSSTGYKKRRKVEQQILGDYPTKRGRSKGTNSCARLSVTDAECYQNSDHLNLKSSVGLTEWNFFSGLMSILPSHLTEYEDPFEPTPIFEAPSPILGASFITNDNKRLASIGETARCNHDTPQELKQSKLLLEKVSVATRVSQTHNFSPAAKTRVAKMA